MRKKGTLKKSKKISSGTSWTHEFNVKNKKKVDTSTSSRKKKVVLYT